MEMVMQWKGNQMTRAERGYMKKGFTDGYNKMIGNRL